MTNIYTNCDAVSNAGALFSPQILHRPGNILIQLFCCMHGPVRVPQQFPGEENSIRLPAFNYLFGLQRIGDQADCTGGNAVAGANLFGKGDLKTRDLRLNNENDLTLCMSLN
jgi:hypothetical protein